MQYEVTLAINVGGDFHQSGDVLRTAEPGTIDTMLRMGQIREACPVVAKPVVEPVTLAAVPDVEPVAEPPSFETPPKVKKTK